MKQRTVYAVVHFKHGWLIDTCAGGTYGPDEVDATTFPSMEAAQAAMTAGELGQVDVDYEVVPLVEITQPRS